MLLDAILDLGDPGISSESWPAWVNELCQDMTYLSAMYVQTTLQAKRKKLDEEAIHNKLLTENN